MNQIKKIFLILMASCGAVLIASEIPQHFEVVNLCDLTDLQLNEFMTDNHSQMVVEFSAGTSLPISLFLKGDLLKLIDNGAHEGVLKVARTFYVRYVDQELSLSADLTDWKPFLTFITGNTSISLSMEDGRPCITAGAEINRRL